MQTLVVNERGAVHLDQTASARIDPVCEFYTDRPYPPPVENPDRARDEWQDKNGQRSEYHLFWPHKKYRADLDILIAGCGTWQAAKYALCHPAAHVAGIDVSTTSLEFGRWFWQAPYLPRCGSIAATPHAKRIAGLSEREPYTAMKLWRGTITCHSVVVYRSGTSRNGASFSFAGNRWASFVPLRLPTTICVRQRLPRSLRDLAILNLSTSTED